MLALDTNGIFALCLAWTILTFVFLSIGLMNWISIKWRARQAERLRLLRLDNQEKIHRRLKGGAP